MSDSVVIQLEHYLTDSLDEAGCDALFTAVTSDPAWREELLTQTRMSRGIAAILTAPAAEDCWASIALQLARRTPSGRQRTAQSVAQRITSRPQRMPDRRAMLRSIVALAAALVLVVSGWLLWPTASGVDDGLAVLVAVQGEVTEEEAGRSTILRTGAAIHPGAQLRTAVGASAKLRFGDGSLVDVAAGSRLAWSAGGPGGALHLDLLDGGIAAHVVHRTPQQALVVSTSDAEISVVGTRFTVAIADVGTRLAVSEGLVRFTDRSSGATSLVGAGHDALARRNRIAPAAEIAGAWIAVTPTGMILTGPDDYGVMDVVADPAHPGTAYAFACRTGAWATTDFGLTWSKVSRDGGPLDSGKTVAVAIAPDGSSLLATISNAKAIFSSTDQGVSWTAHALAVSPFSVDVDAGDRRHAIASSASDNRLFETLDAGETWVDQGAMGGASVNSAVHVLLDGSTVLAVSAGDSGAGTWRGVKSGGTWAWSEVSRQQHDSGSHQLWIDRDQRLILNPGVMAGSGIDLSRDNGLTWTSASPHAADAVIATATTIYAGRSFPITTIFDPRLQQAACLPGAAWTLISPPVGMSNGPKRFAMMKQGRKTIIISGNWLAGLWRYVEPATASDHTAVPLPTPSQR